MISTRSAGVLAAIAALSAAEPQVGGANLPADTNDLKNASFVVSHRVPLSSVTNGVDVRKLYAVAAFVDHEMAASPLRDSMRDMITTIRASKPIADIARRGEDLMNLYRNTQSVGAHFAGFRVSYTADYVAPVAKQVQDLIDLTLDYHQWAKADSSGGNSSKAYAGITSIRSKINVDSDRTARRATR